MYSYKYDMTCKIVEIRQIFELKYRNKKKWILSNIAYRAESTKYSLSW